MSKAYHESIESNKKYIVASNHAMSNYQIILDESNLSYLGNAVQACWCYWKMILKVDVTKQQINFVLASITAIN